MTDKQKPFVILYKPLGTTPLATIEQYRSSHPQYCDIKLSYAGRLDPMAEGLLLILVGDANKKRRIYEKLDKTYECLFLFGIATDSYDTMGLITKQDKPPTTTVLKKNILNIVPRLQGNIIQELPPYSSYRINGRPLYAWARENKLKTIALPQTTITIYDIKFDGIVMEKTHSFVKSTIQTIEHVEGKFRQNEIIEGWKQFHGESKISEFPVASFTIKCSSGTYIRALTKRFEQLLHTPCMVRHIKRTTIGKYNESDIQT